MNIPDVYDPRAVSNLKANGDALLQMCLEQPMNLTARMPATWHLGVTLQSNNPNVSFEQMDTALHEWSWLINRDALGKRSNQHLSKQWRWIAAYEGQQHNDHNTPHWHLIMTTGFGLKAGKANEALRETRVNRRIGKAVIFGARRAPIVEMTFARCWRRLMPKGDVRTDYLHHPFDEKAWLAYMLKYVTGKRFIDPLHIARAQDRLRIGGYGFPG